MASHVTQTESANGRLTTASAGEEWRLPSRQEIIPDASIREVPLHKNQDTQSTVEEEGNRNSITRKGKLITVPPLTHVNYH